mgnify:CR=1 FL=1
MPEIAIIKFSQHGFCNAEYEYTSFVARHISKWETVSDEELAILKQCGYEVIEKVAPTDSVSVRSIVDECIGKLKKLEEAKAAQKLKNQKAAEARKAKELEKKKAQLEKLQKELGTK